MTDPRLTPANAHIAKRGMPNPPEGRTPVDGEVQYVTADLIDLCDTPNGKRERQLLRGTKVLVLDRRDGWAFLQLESGYVGYVPATASELIETPCHFVQTAATFAYTDEDIKSATTFNLPFGARIRVSDERKKFFETDVGFVPKKHLRPLEQPLTDPAAAAQLFFGVPYLWGGNSTRGIDCSGLISAAFESCGYIVPGDSDLQQDSFGEALARDAKVQRGDLVFWSGHVGLMVDDAVMLHANAHHMACRYEPLADAITRIAAQGDGGITAKKRVV